MSATPDMGDALSAVASAAGGYFKSSKQKTIALIVAGVVVLGVLGAVSSLVFGGNSEATTVPTPGVATDPGDVFEPVPETPSDTPTPGPTANPSTTTNSVTIKDGVTFNLPNGWEVISKGDTFINIHFDQHCWLFGTVGSTQSTDAIAVAPSILRDLLPDAKYSNVRFSDPKPIEGFDSFVSTAMLHYQATETDLQSPMPVAGLLHIFIRHDGEVLILNPEYPQSEDPLPDRVIDPLVSIEAGAIGSFGGLG